MSIIPLGMSGRRNKHDSMIIRNEAANIKRFPNTPSLTNLSHPSAVENVSRTRLNIIIIGATLGREEIVTSHPVVRYSLICHVHNGVPPD
ncbi:hypothetical protein CDAR_297411 [Caerostris darwini]|uniref:Uncharacterized protein n=1 Tax=Caerostris darwini TaxID=1538125 RepID=A0AAV4PQP9_9ARAC|nr:hypothetical protein CDAR_297411 [Caerostris darwini]